MKPVLIFLLALFTLSKCEEASNPRRARGSFQTSYPLGNNLQIGGVDVESYGKGVGVPLRNTDLYAPGVDDVLPIQHYKQSDIDLNVDLTGARHRGPQLHEIASLNYIVSNSIDKPVQEAQDNVPPQSLATAIIPPVPPPAIPINAVAANVPAERGAVFLGSGSLGVIDLGGGAYALGSGSIGYSRVRANPRSSFKAPLLPPVQAAPNLLPAAVPSPEPPQPPVFDFNHPLLGGRPPVDENGYEYLPPSSVSFGDPLPPRPLKTTMAFATPSNLLVQSQVPNYQQTVPQVYGQRINTVYADTFYH
ncbi:uncharacterized protein LOC108903646 [Anoplophora glabripennis]|uniref:uncharacterized protein LOC108903646 n=1 Tax=Anoplophora glabripennis TaxID=217634 RepID=UPI0008746ECF|nr:uncharacterized protein LOC108903646 [Anoplophora glabripennis]